MIMNEDYFLELQNNDMSKIPRTAVLAGGTDAIQKAVGWELLRQFRAQTWAETEDALIADTDFVARAEHVSRFTGIVGNIANEHPELHDLITHHACLDNTNQCMYVCGGTDVITNDRRVLKIVDVFDDLVVIEYGPTREKLYFVRRRKPETMFGVAVARATARTNDTNHLGTRRIDDVEYVYPTPCNAPYAPGQHKRFGHAGAGTVNDLDYYIEPINAVEFSDHIQFTNSDMGISFFSLDFDELEKD